MMTPIHVVGIGLDGAFGLSETVQAIVRQAGMLVGSDRHLSYFPQHPAIQVRLDGFSAAIAQIRQHLQSETTTAPIVVLTSGDPLFFGFGRLLLTEFPAEQLTFHPHLSSVQLAFSQVKLPWQDARIISAHGRSLDELTTALQQGAPKLAVLTDHTNTPAAIAQLLQSLDLPVHYRVWICENLGGMDETITETQDYTWLQTQTFAALNVVILHRLEELDDLAVEELPLLGLPDQHFLSFRDRPGLMTKREIRTLILAELALQPAQIVWDIGAGTGSVAIEIARLCPNSAIFAIEKTALGIALIQQNSQRFQVKHVKPIEGTAPQALTDLPDPDRIFIGGSGGSLTDILTVCCDRLKPGGRIVLALATLEHLSTAHTWFKAQQSSSQWTYSCTQVQISRSIPIASLTRFTPLNPVTLITAEKSLQTEADNPPARSPHP